MAEEKGKSADKRQDSPEDLRGKERADEVHRRNQERKDSKGTGDGTEGDEGSQGTPPAEGQE